MKIQINLAIVFLSTILLGSTSFAQTCLTTIEAATMGTRERIASGLPICGGPDDPAMAGQAQQEEQRRQNEEAQNRQREEQRRNEEQNRQRGDQGRQEEERRRNEENQNRRREEQRRNEENRRREEEQRRHEDRPDRDDGRRQHEEQRRQEEQRRWEEDRRQQEELQRRADELQRREEELRRREQDEAQRRWEEEQRRNNPPVVVRPPVIVPRPPVVAPPSTNETKVLLEKVTRKAGGQWNRLTLAKPVTLESLAIKMKKAGAKIHEVVLVLEGSLDRRALDEPTHPEKTYAMNSTLKLDALFHHGRIVAIDVRAESMGGTSTLEVTVKAVERKASIKVEKF